MNANRPMSRGSARQGHRDFNKQLIINLQNSVSVHTYYIRFWAFSSCSLNPNTAKSFAREEHAEGSSRCKAWTIRACFRVWSLGGNQGLDKHRMVPPFLKFSSKQLW